MTTALDLDLAELVGELPDVPCGESQHGSNKLRHDDGPATTYIQVLHACIAEVGSVRPVCAKMSAVINSLSDQLLKCWTCGRHAFGREFLIVAGPVNGRAS